LPAPSEPRSAEEANIILTAIEDAVQESPTLLAAGLGPAVTPTFVENEPTGWRLAPNRPYVLWWPIFLTAALVMLGITVRSAH